MNENANTTVGTNEVTTENVTSNTNSNAAEPLTMTQEEFNKAIQSAEDKLRTKYSKEIKSLQDKVKELSPVQKSEGELELEKRLAELEDKQREVDEREKILKLQAALQKASLDVGMADYIKPDTDIEQFASAINAIVDSRVKSAGFQPSGHANNQGMTKEKWSNLRYSEKAKFMETNPELAKTFLKK